MYPVLQVITVMLVAVAMALALDHALELPGKMRLSEEQYLATQTIYYPGFTIGGAAEPIGLLASFLLLLATPVGTVGFWLTAAAFLALLAMHTAYWLLVHPVNNFWLKDSQLPKTANRFFSFDPLNRSLAIDSANPSWTSLRDRWELSHVLRAGLGSLSLALLVTALAIRN
jgi:hypothetical protein